MRWFLAVLLLTRLPLAAGPAADIAAGVRANSFDRDECYRIRDLSIIKQDIRIYLSDGYLIFGKPVAGRRIAAAFVGDVEGGDGEVLVLPPTRGERRSLASYTGSPNLNEHFKRAMFFFTGDVYDALKAQMPKNPANKKAPEMGAVLDEEWAPVLRNLSASYQTRIALDLLAGPSKPGDLLVSLFVSEKHDNFDLVYDPQVPEQISAGQVVTRDNRTFFDIWTSFAARSFRNSEWKSGYEAQISDYRISATVEPDLNLTAVTRFKFTPTSELAAIPFDISRDMAVSEVTVDGAPAEVLLQEALRANLGRGGNQLFLVLPATPLRAGRQYEFEFHHAGKVIRDTGDHVLYVTSRGNWYPGNGLQFATFDLSFRYPKELDLVAAGEVVEDRSEGEWRITRRRTNAPIRWAGFNLGRYIHTRVSRGGYAVEVYANRSLEEALRPRQIIVDTPVTMPQLGRIRGAGTQTITVPPPIAASPTDRLQSLASDVASALEFMTSKFGPPALPLLTVSPIPDTFGQGFPGLIYLSTRSYLPPGTASRNRQADTFYSDILLAHETAHQWWGNLVAATGYHDNWMMEALAHYSALLYLEKRKGTPWLEQTMAEFRDGLLLKNDEGLTVDSTGPIVLGLRLESSQEPRAWRTITYGKGAWILHMLRRRMGDVRFFTMLSDLRKNYERKELTTEAFRLFASKYLPPKSPDPQLEGFFDQWVYNTGIPSFKLTHSVKGKAPNVRLVGTLTQSGVDDDFEAPVPVEIQVARGKTVVEWVTSSNEPVTFTVPLQQAPLKVTLDPRNSVLRK